MPSFVLLKQNTTINIHDYIWLAEGCLWHLLPRQTCCRHLLTGGMFLLLQRNFFSYLLCAPYITLNIALTRLSKPEAIAAKWIVQKPHVLLEGSKRSIVCTLIQLDAF